MTSNGLYHERQVKELCALHALNNLFQSNNAFTKTELDLICHDLSPNNWINPHKSMLGLGNYDVNVIMKALQSRGCEAIWFDKRKDPSCLNLDQICGFIFNVPSDYKISFVTRLLGRRHWIAVRKLNGVFYNLDSKLDAPQVIGSDADLLNFVREQLECKDKELFIVVTNEAEKEHSWMNMNSSYCTPVVNMDDRDAEEILVGDFIYKHDFNSTMLY